MKRQTCAGNEAKGIISRLHVLPEVDVGVVEDVAVEVEVVEALHLGTHIQLDLLALSPCLRLQMAFITMQLPIALFRDAAATLKAACCNLAMKPCSWSMPSNWPFTISA